MPTVRINIIVATTDPVVEALKGTFQVHAGGCVDVYRILRDIIRQMPQPLPQSIVDEDIEG